jgi:hypothetical protein
MRTPRLGLAVSLLVLIGGAAAAVAMAGSAPTSSRSTSLSRIAGVNFISNCAFSHQNNDDLIVYPGQPGLSHLHQYVGNDSTNALSTEASLLAATTSCKRSGDTASYWAPALLSGTTPITPASATIYYRRSTLKAVHPFPQGLKMIAGDSHATTPQSMRVTSWNCGVFADVPSSSTIPTCPDGSNLRLHVRFPSCWDGKNLDSADHKSHMAYAVGGRCPGDHPVSVPAIELIMKYPSLGGAGLQLSSGGQYSGHADFVNAWKQPVLKRLVKTCLNAQRRCGAR